MSKQKIYLRNLTANWIGYAIRLIVMFFLSPFVVHSLGNTAYGVWCLLVSLTGYMGLLDVGIMASTSRYINLYLATNDRQRISHVINTSLCFYVGVCVILLLAATIISPFLGKIFVRIPNPLVRQAQWMLYLFCANIFAGFIAGLLRQLLAANDRFDLEVLASLIVLGFSTTATVLLLKAGYGLVPLAIVQVVSSLTGISILFILAKRYGPEFEISSSFVRRNTFRELMNFGIYAFIADVGVQLIFYTDSIVIGLFIGAAAITLYNVGLILIEASMNVMREFRKVLVPDLLKCSGAGSLSDTRWLVVKSTRFFMLVAVPLLVGFVLLGKEFIFLWMGPGYVESASVLSLLAISQFGNIASFSCWITLMGMGRVKFLGFVAFVEGILNLFLSIMLVTVFHLGIVGVALGTLIPMVGLTRVLVPIYTCRILQMKISEFARATVLRWLTATLLFALPCFFASNVWSSPSWPGFFVKVAILVIIYLPIGFCVLLTKEERKGLVNYLKKRNEFKLAVENT